jgi:hypothetical protein
MADTTGAMSPAVDKILGGKGKKLHTHEVHLRRTKNKGYIARHELRDKDGNAPTDGQKSDAEYSLPDKYAMLAHMEQHMGTPSPDQDDDQQQEQQAQA